MYIIIVMCRSTAIEDKATNSDHSISSRAVHVTTAIHIALALALTSMTPSHAQDASATDLEEIVVIGIRGSLDRALDVKRNASGFVDAVSAEDVGKLPDGNVAEALQRVTGVAIQRYRGEGDFVSIRGLGPNFVRSVVNGRTMLSATEYGYMLFLSGLNLTDAEPKLYSDTVDRPVSLVHVGARLEFLECERHFSPTVDIWRPPHGPVNRLVQYRTK